MVRAQVTASSIMDAVSSGMVIGPPFGEDFVRQAYIDARAIDVLEANVRSFKVPLETSLRQVVQPSIVENFASQGRPAWKPLAENTLLRRGWQPTKTIRRGPLSLKTKNPTKSFRILDDTGRLKKAATQLNMWEVKDDQLTFRVTFFSQKVQYGVYHQLGTNKMYARQFITLGGNDDLTEIQKIFDFWLIERVNKYWGEVISQ